ncbi:Target of rapamycin complex 1 subunit kog1, partial [Coemansia biformis]
MLHKLPDTVQDRGTPIGELTWIITTVADTIAWDVLPRKQFHKLFRHDAAVAALFRNFMLADHIMRFYGVHPQSSPALPAMHKHPLWATLELEIEKCLAQVPRLLKEDGRRKRCEKQIKHFKQTIAARTN